MTFVNWNAAGSLYSIAIDPSGRFVFETSYHGYVGTYTVDSASGALTDSGIPGVLFPSDSPTTVSVDPLGRFVYVAYSESIIPGPPSYRLLVIALSLDSKTGALSRIASPVTTDAADWFATDPSGRFLYVGNIASNNIAAFKVSPANGTLTAVPGSPFAAGNGPGSAAADPYGKYLYVVNSGSNDISAYAIDQASGQLTPINGSPFPTGHRRLRLRSSLSATLSMYLTISGSQPTRSMAPMGH